MLRPLFAICILIILLLAFSFPYLEPGSESFIVAIFAAVPVILVMIAILVMLATGWKSHWE